MSAPNGSRVRHPLIVPAVLWACFSAGVAWSLLSGAPGFGGGLLTAAPIAAIAWAVRTALQRR
ncbi:MAG: hypothetical protein IT365_25185 [Candidatus Hydrogenedentes bacterium]|nr:hypothetical protein [Candidatus Hydrogenedentota bacterium]